MASDVPLMDVLLDSIEEIGNRIVGLGKKVAAAFTGRGDDAAPSRSSGATPMEDGKIARAPDATPAMAFKKSVGGGPSQAMALGTEDHEEVPVQTPKIFAIKNPQDLSFLKAMAANDGVLYAMSNHSPADNVQPAAIGVGQSMSQGFSRSA